MLAEGEQLSLDRTSTPSPSNSRDVELSRMHPLFSSIDGDVVLGAREGTVLFRTHSYTLKTTSGWFRAMFSLPQKASEQNPTLDVIYLDEDARTLESLLRMISGLPIPELNSYDDIDAILYAADKYDMPGPMSIIRFLCMTPLLDHPLRLYAVACRFGWDVEARLASTHTLNLNLRAAEHRASLQRLNTDALLNLFDLHHARREDLRKQLDSHPFVNGSTSICVSCGSLVDYHTWRELKYRILREMDVRPSGDTIGPGLVDWPEAKACWKAKCTNAHCDKLLYDKAESLRNISDCIGKLPKTV